ncbi:uncharacterized protein LOC127074249 [Lathyrus oleraceus]|uniref:Uncharacterized protein n=1 Tax=Pisum sativum TaxID=3888 RepID=A0A9D5BMW7_PEA|nr:uncharacterized protein LOC127074249 [Pisum sativum]KAI5446603.1 hypothetical protein KIW84_014440 [Pisum sativum]
MKEHQTPTKLSARSAENRTGKSKDSPANKSKKAQISNKSLNASSASVSEESSNSSLISEIKENNLDENVTTFLLEEASSVTLLQPEKLTDTTENSSGSCFDVCEFEGAKFNSMEDQITMNFLKNFKPGEILTFDNADPRYKKLRDEIIEYVLQDLKRNVLPGDGNHTLSPSQGLSRKNRLVFLSVIIWFIAILVILFCTPDADCGLVAT